MGQMKICEAIIDTTEGLEVRMRCKQDDQVVVNVLECGSLFAAVV